MAETNDSISQNHASLARLRALCEGLTDDNLDRSLESGWTVATMLAHLAFWDREVTTCLLVWERLPPDEVPSRVAERTGWINGETLAPLLRAGLSEAQVVTMSAEQINEALAPRWAHIPPRQAAEDALQAAGEIDLKLTTLDPTLRALIEKSDKAWMLVPSEHWDEHIDQIEASIGG